MYGNIYDKYTNETCQVGVECLNAVLCFIFCIREKEHKPKYNVAVST